MIRGHGVFVRKVIINGAYTRLKELVWGELACDWICYMVQDGIKSINDAGADNDTARLKKQCDGQGLQIAFGHYFDGSDPVREAQLFEKRLRLHNVKDAVVIIRDGIDKRSVNALTVYFDTLKYDPVVVILPKVILKPGMDDVIRKHRVMPIVELSGDVKQTVGNAYRFWLGAKEILCGAVIGQPNKIREYASFVATTDIQTNGWWMYDPEVGLNLNGDGKETSAVIKALGASPRLKTGVLPNTDPKPPIIVPDADLGQDSEVLMHKGVDISKYNEVINWTALKADGVEFAIIRSGQGPFYVDWLAQKHKTDAKANDVPFGWYHFYDYKYPDGKPQFENMKRIVNFDWGDVAPSIDFETLYSYVPATKKEPAKRVPVPLPPRNTCYTELMEIGLLMKQTTGKKPQMYIGNLISFLKPDAAMLDMFDLWFANWNPKPGPTAPWKSWLCWQAKGDIVLPNQSGVWDINWVKDEDWTNFIHGSVTQPMTLEERVARLEKMLGVA